MAGRISLRRILAEHAHVDARDVVIEEGENRKPAVSLPGGVPPVYFNVSHSGDYIVIAISRAAEVGVDIEEMRPDCPVDDLARRYYSTREYAWLRTLAGEDRIEAFYRLWTVKEAVLKCAGLGLSVPTRMVEVLLDDGAPSVTCRDKDRKALEQLQVTELHPVPGYAGALASAAYTEIRVVPNTI